ncbi:SURF1 family protein [Thalassotalea sp. LPB0316]|uniref:SURF1 family protein n=1 Tax=Thalassotalea sp. LPB0316 TaxID=2769490 RepID=UPI0018681C51|nr:SURF1 family protein [Thalassotalea sp. LPB0316]QOL26209.1 SURF1 family protein [Thalassotalea sp. LPB0316]
MGKFSYQHLVLTLFTLLVFSALIKLGLWQLNRAHEKEARIEQMAIWQQQGGISLASALQVFSKTPEIANDLLVNERGSFTDDPIFLLDNQVSNGQFGYRALQVFEVDQQHILVNLGWLAGDRSRQVMPSVQAISGEYSLSGALRIVEPGITLKSLELKENNGTVLIQQIELEKISRLINKQLLPFVFYLDKNEDIGYEKNWQPIVMPPEKHRGYAFQWFSLAIAWLALMGFAARKYKNNKA